MMVMIMVIFDHPPRVTLHRPPPSPSVPRYPKEAPEVKLSEGSRRKPKDAEGREKVASFGNLWRFLRGT